ncbi:MAG: GYD domain-containing protein [Sandaracinaceae bacterium]|nr:GYD domain-containing protein [Sandaracinaceae bacterium]
MEKVRAFYALLGSAHDTMFIVDAPDDEAVAKMALAIASKGSVRTESHRLLTEAEYAVLVRALP